MSVTRRRTYAYSGYQYASQSDSKARRESGDDRRPATNTTLQRVAANWWSPAADEFARFLALAISDIVKAGKAALYGAIPGKLAFCRFAEQAAPVRYGPTKRPVDQ
jgi:hypothetical protein